MEWSFDNWNNGSYSLYANLDSLTFEYEQRLIIKRPTYCLRDIIVEMLKVSLIKLYFDNWVYVSNPINANFGLLPFYGDQRLINVQRMYRVNGDII